MTEGDAIARAESVVPIVKAAKRRIEERRALPEDVLLALHEARLFRLMLPRAIGGDECDLLTFARVLEILSEANASVAWCVGQGGGCAMSAAFLAPDVAARIFGPRDAVLAWGAGVQGTAIAVEGGYRVSGRWTFASGSRHATLLGAHCRVVEADGSPRLKSDGTPVDRTALLPRDEALVDDVWNVVGLKGTGSDSYEIRDLFVPQEETLNREDQGELKVAATLYRFPTMHAYAAGFAGVMLGIARGALSDLKDLALTKTPRGAASPLRDSPVFQAELARMEVRLRAARALHHQNLAEAWAEVEGGQGFTLDRRVALRMSSTHAINEGADIVHEAYRAAGQNAIFENAPFEQRLRDALSASQQVQGRPAHFVTAGRHLLGLRLDTSGFV
jgi:alkylation response protein AidB-like acyl-CoA dehydrogenase